jgi:hypothetical protein
LRHLKERRMIAQQQQEALSAAAAVARRTGGYAGPAPRPGVLSAWEPPSGKPRWRPEGATTAEAARAPSSLSVVSARLAVVGAAPPASPLLQQRRAAPRPSGAWR